MEEKQSYGYVVREVFQRPPRLDSRRGTNYTAAHCLDHSAIQFERFLNDFRDYTVGGERILLLK